DRCPVCSQSYDRDSTRVHLEELLAGARTDARQRLPEPAEVASAAHALADAEKAQAAAEMQLRAAQESLARQRTRAAEVSRRLKEASLEGEIDNPSAGLRQVLESLERRAHALEVHQGRGEHLALGVAQAGDRARHASLEREIDSLREELQREENAIAA